MGSLVVIRCQANFIFCHKLKAPIALESVTWEQNRSYRLSTVMTKLLQKYMQENKWNNSGRTNIAIMMIKLPPLWWHSIRGTCITYMYNSRNRDSTAFINFDRRLSIFCMVSALLIIAFLPLLYHLW